MYKLIVSDLDDTLLKDDLTISNNNKEAIYEAIDNGYLFTIATGRVTEAAEKYAKELNLELPIITYQGACIYDYNNKAYLHTDALQRDRIIPVIEYAEKNNIHCNLYVDGVLYIKEHNKWSDYYSSYAKELPVKTVGSLLDFDFDKTVKLSLIEEFDRAEFTKLEVEKLIDKNTNIFFSKANFIEMTNIKSTKGFALEKFANLYNIKMEEIITIGDSYNDLSMIKCAGLGICMENGREDVKKVADYITLSNEEDGVAEVINKFALGKVEA